MNDPCGSLPAQEIPGFCDSLLSFSLWFEALFGGLCPGALGCLVSGLCSPAAPSLVLGRLRPSIFPVSRHARSCD